MNIDTSLFAPILDWLEGQAPPDLDRLAKALDDNVRELSDEQLELLRRYLQRLPDFYRSRRERTAGLGLICSLLAAEGGWQTHFRRDLLDEVGAWAESGGELSLHARSAFGALTEAHREQLRRAIHKGVLSRRELLECAWDGQALGDRLGELPSPVPLSFSTTDLNGSPLSQPAGQSWYGEPVDLATRGGQRYRMLVSTETELDQIVVTEPTTVDWLERTLTDDSVLYDVGANIGIYSLYSLHARPGCHVVAFEPAPMNFHRLLLNYQLNGLGAGTVFPFAVSDRSGPTTFSYNSMIPGSCSHQGAHVAGDAAGSDVVAGAYACSLDQLLEERADLPRPSHLKIDVDGHESEILKGARQCLQAPELRYLVVETQASMLPRVVRHLSHAGFEQTEPRFELFGNAFFERP